MCNVRVKATMISLTHEDRKNDEQRHGYGATDDKKTATCSTSGAKPDESMPPPSSAKLGNMVSISSCSIKCKLHGGVFLVNNLFVKKEIWNCSYCTYFWLQLTKCPSEWGVGLR